MSESKKPMEFWIERGSFNWHAETHKELLHGWKTGGVGPFHVIEKSAYDKQQAVIADLLKALEFYGDKDNWNDIYIDEGDEDSFVGDIPKVIVSEDVQYIENVICCAGKTAREAIARAKRELGEV